MFEYLDKILGVLDLLRTSLLTFVIVNNHLSFSLQKGAFSTFPLPTIRYIELLHMPFFNSPFNVKKEYWAYQVLYTQHL